MSPILLQGITNLLHNLVKMILTNEPPNTKPLRTSLQSFNSPSAFGLVLPQSWLMFFKKLDLHARTIAKILEIFVRIE
jgi:hypothetical protein